MVDYNAAKKIAAKFLGEANPSLWNGKEGKLPDNFYDTRIYTYDIDDDFIELDISLEYRDDGCIRYGWGCYCELRTKDEDADLVGCAFEFGIDSIDKLAELIVDVQYN